MAELEKIGTHYPGNPIPLVKSDTVFFDAGAIQIGVAKRSLSAAEIERAYTADGSVKKEIAQDRIRRAALVEGDADSGPSIHIVASETGEEFLRFDCFRDEPHYHYLRPGISNIVVKHDPYANGEFVGWVLNRIAQDLPNLLRVAGAQELADVVDRERIAGVLPQVRELLRKLT